VSNFAFSFGSISSDSVMVYVSAGVLFGMRLAICCASIGGNCSARATSLMTDFALSSANVAI
jgi:hypothetical protein